MCQIYSQNNIFSYRDVCVLKCYNEVEEKYKDFRSVGISSKTQARNKIWNIQGDCVPFTVNKLCNSP